MQKSVVVGCVGSLNPNPDPREDLESRSPNLGPYTTKGTLQEPPIKGSTFLDPPAGLGLKESEKLGTLPYLPVPSTTYPSPERSN